jgi:cytoskeletal protein RodZ
MFKSFRGKIAFSGVTVLLIGVALLIFTFLSAYGFLAESLNIIATEDLVRTFGEALAPLIGTCIRVMYLGIMGWIGSLVTIRGVTIIANAPKLEAPIAAPVPTPAPAAPQAKPVPAPAPQKPTKAPPPKETKPVPKAPPEPEIIVIPPEEMMPQQPPAESTQPQQAQQQPPPQPQQQNNNNNSNGAQPQQQPPSS